MRELHNSFIGRNFLRSMWANDYEVFKGSEAEAALEKRLVQWAARADLKETSAEGPFVEEFFRRTWGYVHSGQDGSGDRFTLYPKFPIPGAGAKGGHGEADLAVGYFSNGESDPVPQIVCEFKDIKSALDAPQKSRKGGMSPVKQCLNYLSHARRGFFGNEPMIPTWGIVSDMNEFRLYWHDREQQYVKFTVRQPDLYTPGLLTVDGRISPGDDARFDRFLFWKLFHRDTLITEGGRPLLLQLVAKQWVKERALEKTFYAEYRAYRERLYLTLLENNPSFPGTRGRLVRLAQKILDRCIFIFFCEDMGAALQFPAQLLRDYLIDRSKDAWFDPKGRAIWDDLIRLFKVMNTGGAFGPGKNINAFNGGLFADDAELDSLTVPNEVFCRQGQGQNEASLYQYRETLLYLSASYNYAGGWAKGLTKPPVGDAVKDTANAVKADPEHSLGLYTLGRIFEQSITELEILEAEAEGRPSINKESKRKRDGVYYTPEWVVERIVAETLGPRLAELRSEAGWPADGLPNAEQIEAYRNRLEKVTVVDPACGSGAMLITALRYLLDEAKAVQAVREQVTGRKPMRDDDTLIRDILRQNVYGVDINPASVEIARLALWLHTARGDQPLSSLESTIKEGNSLIGSDFYRGVQLSTYDAEERDRVNVFDWDKEFPEVFEAGGFDAVIGNPPYVKLQNFRKVHADMAEFIRDGRRAVGIPGYASAQTGNFDLYLPFIEKGLALLNEGGRLGFIAPSLWTVNEYGAGLRNLIAKGGHLDRWLDFKSFQIFEEATTYTALQFFSKAPNDAVRVAYAPDGVLADDPWEDPQTALPYDRLAYGDRWLLATGPERELIDKLTRSCRRLDDPSLTSQIFQGLITSADQVYHLTRLGPNRYLHTPVNRLGMGTLDRRANGTPS